MIERAPREQLSEISPEEKRWDTLVDQGIFSPDQADMKIYGARKSEVADEPPVSAPAQRSTGHTSRRGGRSFSQPSDSDLDPAWNPPYTKPDGAEVDAVHASPGYRAMVAKLLDIGMKADHRKADGDVLMELVYSRARAERRARQQL